MEKGITATPATVEGHIPALRRFARALLRGDRQRADDLVQDSLERALAHWHQSQPDRELRGWLFTILFNGFVTERELWRHSLDELEKRDVPSGDGARQRSLPCRDLLRGFAQLSQDQRTVLLLVGVEDFTYEETARILGVPVGTVMSRLSRGRERLRRYMNEDRPRRRPPLSAAMRALTQPPLTVPRPAAAAAAAFPRCGPRPGAVRLRLGSPPYSDRITWRSP
jgi:RNA polymerase sigma-70 factor (ECF subfamily)